MKKHAPLAILLGVVVSVSLVALSLWLIVGPKRWLKGRCQRFHKTQAEKA